MSRYIDADKVKENFFPAMWDTVAESWWKESRIASLLDKTPRADVAPVIHAHWTRVNDAENVYMCDGKDGCGCCIQVTRGTPIDNDLGFCPHCGAKMDGKENEE